MEKNNPTHVKDYLHLYLGCPVIVLTNGEPNTLWGVEQENTVITWNEEWGRTIRHTNSIKPLLRPLSDMTDEELQECGNMIYDFSDEPELNNHKWQDFEIGLAPEQFHYLLCKHFDLFGLIEAGLAIDKTQI